jgi:hypothetical protein
MDDDQQPTLPEPPNVPPPPPAQPVEPRGLSAQPAGPIGAPVGLTNGRIRMGAVFMLIGGGIVLLSTFLPRFTITTAAGTTSIGGLQSTGFGTLILAGFAIAKGFEALRPGSVRMRLGSPIITGVFMAVLLALRWSDLQDGLDTAAGIPGMTASIGSGFWLNLTGAVLVLCGGALIQFGDRVP